MGASLQAPLIGQHHLDWDLQLPQIMRMLRATPHTITGDASNYLMLAREVHLPEHLSHLETVDGDSTTTQYAQGLKEQMECRGEATGSTKRR